MKKHILSLFLMSLPFAPIIAAGGGGAAFEDASTAGGQGAHLPTCFACNKQITEQPEITKKKDGTTQETLNPRCAIVPKGCVNKSHFHLGCFTARTVGNEDITCPCCNEKSSLIFKSYPIKGKKLPREHFTYLMLGNTHAMLGWKDTHGNPCNLFYQIENKDSALFVPGDAQDILKGTQSGVTIPYKVAIRLLTLAHANSIPALSALLIAFKQPGLSDFHQTMLDLHVSSLIEIIDRRVKSSHEAIITFKKHTQKLQASNIDVDNGPEMALYDITTSKYDDGFVIAEIIGSKPVTPHFK